MDTLSEHPQHHHHDEGTPHTIPLSPLPMYIGDYGVMGIPMMMMMYRVSDGGDYGGHNGGHYARP